MYSSAWSPTPSTTAVAPELRTKNRSPTTPRRNMEPLRRAVADDVAGDDVLGRRRRSRRAAGGPRSGRRRGPCRRSRSSRPRGRSVIPRGMNAPNDCAGRAGEVHHDRSPGASPCSPRARDLVAEHRADGARRCCGWADRSRRLIRRSPASSACARSMSWHVEVLRRARGSAAHVAPRLVLGERAGRAAPGVRSRPSGLPVLHRAVDVEQLGAADHLVERAEAELGEVLAHFLAR